MIDFDFVSYVLRIMGKNSRIVSQSNTIGSNNLKT